jgi:hydroxymethylpyrimidine/phosphomethylpyrimidine kinase
MPQKPPVVLSIAGYDPSSGAGVTADVRTAAAHGCFAVTCITALTVQNTVGVHSVEPVRGDTVRRTLAAIAEDFDIAAVKIGMLGSSEVAHVVADFLSTATVEHVVLDPIMRSSSGADLIDTQGPQILCQRLIPFATVVTPNVEEAIKITGLSDSKSAARRLHEMGAKAVVVTGGDMDETTDLLYVEGRFEQFRAPKIESRSTHGTGCAFSTAIACGLANGKAVRLAVVEAKAFVRHAIETAPKLGQHCGPMNLDSE